MPNVNVEFSFFVKNIIYSDIHICIHKTRLIVWRIKILAVEL